ncbi:hypothetical protein NFI96_024936 [Prochilodus magdalenae]|nr:hypothetical protein NFI96_024936 [Prochilodus magdalenae]
MAEILFSLHLYPWDGMAQERLVGEIQLSIFLITGLCVGFPVLIWALRVLYRHCISGGRISALVLMLLLSDLLELLLSPYVVTKLLQKDYCWDSSWTCRILTSLWSALVFYGLHLQQVVALEAALFSRHPPCSAHVFFPSCSIIHLTVLGFRTFFLPLVSFWKSETISLYSWVPTGELQPQIRLPDPYTATREADSNEVLAFATSTLILYGAFIIICIVMKDPWDLLVMFFSLLSLIVILDPVVCVLVDRYLQLSGTPL